ncbi:MAG: HDOD domain-containing protein [Chitinivibrionales bacterium]
MRGVCLNSADYRAGIYESIEKLPAFPAVFSKLVEIIDSPDSSADEVAEVLEKDPALSGCLLKVANSAFYGMPRSVTSVQSGVVILGFNTIRSIVLTASIKRSLDSKAAWFDMEEFWRHSVSVALTGRNVALNKIPFRELDPEGVFCGGILHDIGKLVMVNAFPDIYKRVLKKHSESGDSLICTEKEITGMDHTEVGLLIADKWGLPQELESAIVEHHFHESGIQEAGDLSLIVNLSNRIVNYVHSGEQGDPGFSGFLNILSIDENEMKTYIKGVKESDDGIKEFITSIPG